MRVDTELGSVDDLTDAAPASRRRRCSHSENEKSPSLLCRLPHDLAARVLATLPPSARARCAAVCRGWRDLLRDLPQQQLWRELDFTRDDRKVTRESFAGATRRARGVLCVLKVPGDAGITRGAIVAVMRANRESLRVVEALSSEDAEKADEDVSDVSDDDAARIAATGFWNPKQVHEAVSASGPSLATFAVDVRARGACGALVQQLTSPVVRARCLDVRAGTRALDTEDKKRLFAAVAVAASRAASCVSRTLDLGSNVGSDLGLRRLRRLRLASCGLSAEDAEALVAALGSDELAADGGDHVGGAFELDVAENPGLGCAGATALAMLAADGRIHALRMETCGVGEAGARALRDALASRRCALTELDLSRNFLGAGGAAAVAEGLARGAAAGAARLTTLRLGHNAFGCAGASALAAAARASGAFERLERLEAPSNGMGPEGIATLARSVLSARGAPRLRELRLQGNPMGAAGARALARASLALPDDARDDAPCATHGSLRVLGLGSAKLGVVGAAAVAWAMRRDGGALRRISALDLSANDVGESGAALPANLTLTGRDVVRGGFARLDGDNVADELLGDDADHLPATDDEDEHETASHALASLARDLAAAPALRRLDLGYNSLGDAGARVVAAAVASRRVPDARGAVALDLRRNSIGDAGAAALARVLEAARAVGGGEDRDVSSSVFSVDLRSNAIGEEGLEALRAHVEAGCVASNYMPTRWARREPALTEREAPDLQGRGGREEGPAVEVAA